MVDIGGVGRLATPARLLAGGHTMVFCDPGGRVGSAQAHPEWTVLLPLAGHLEWWTGRYPGGRAAGVIFPPLVAYVATSTVGHLAVLVDPWFQGLGPGQCAAVPLDRPTVEQLRALWSNVDEADLDQTARVTVAHLRRRGVLPSAVPIDPRVAAALRQLPAADRIDRLAASVGLSPSRLRALIHDITGMSPTRLRMWQRLRAAMVDLEDKPIAAAAADAGFADQAHLTRTAARLVGRTPGELARTLPDRSTHRHRPGQPATVAVT